MESLYYISVSALPALIGHDSKKKPEDAFRRILRRKNTILYLARMEIKRAICRRDGEDFPLPIHNPTGQSSYRGRGILNMGRNRREYSTPYTSVMPNYLPNSQIFSKSCTTSSGYEFYLSGSPMGFSNGQTVVQIKFTKQRFPINPSQAEIDQISCYVFLTDSKRGVIIYVHNQEEICNDIKEWKERMEEIFNSTLLNDFVRRLHYLYLYGTSVAWWVGYNQLKLYDVDTIFDYIEDGEFEMLEEYLQKRGVSPIP